MNTGGLSSPIGVRSFAPNTTELAALKALSPLPNRCGGGLSKAGFSAMAWVCLYRLACGIM